MAGRPSIIDEAIGRWRVGSQETVVLPIAELAAIVEQRNFLAATLGSHSINAASEQLALPLDVPHHPVGQLALSLTAS